MILHILKFMFYTQLSDITPYIRSTLVAVFICILVLVLLKLISRSRRPLPPGPKGSFLVGNAFQMPTKYEWLTYTEWRKKYGDIVYLNIFGRPLVIINSHKVAVDLLEKRSRIYSGRPVSKMVKLSGMGDALFFSTYNDRLKRLRRALARALSSDVVKRDFRPLMEIEIRDCMEDMLLNPSDFDKHLKRMVAAVIMKLVYGYELKKENDPFEDLAHNALTKFSLISRSGAWLVDVISILEYVPSWFPGAEFKRLAESSVPVMHALVEYPFRFAKKAVKESTAIPSYCSTLLESKEDDDIIKYSASALFGGATDTVVSASRGFMVALLLYPKVQERIHEEIDRVIGCERLPTWNDRESLPYLEAVRKEVIRWNPVTGYIFHATTEESFYDGYRIPNDAIVIGNIWGMMHDERIYRDPMEFCPERFLSEYGTPERDPDDMHFGYGRRGCPGTRVASDEFYLVTAQMCALFNLKRPLDEAGREYMPTVEWTSGTISGPEEFKCRIEPRFKGTGSLLGRV